MAHLWHTQMHKLLLHHEMKTTKEAGLGFEILSDDSWRSGLSFDNLVKTPPSQLSSVCSRRALV